jgi:hypothetical protein
VRRPSLTTWILIAIVAGGAFGYFFPDAATQLRVLSTIFIRLIRTIVAPLLFATLVVGIAAHGNLKQVGRMGVKALVYFEIVTTLALLIGWAAITISQAGVGITLPPPAPGEQTVAPAPQSWQDIILHVFPENIAKAVADGEVLQVVVFSVMFGIGLALVPEPRRRRCSPRGVARGDDVQVHEHRDAVRAIGVGAAIAYTVGHLGIGILVNLIAARDDVCGSDVFILGVRCQSRSSRACRSGASSRPSRSRCPSPSRPRARRRRFHARWRTWRRSASRGGSWRSSSRPGIRSTSMGLRSISRWPRSSSRRQRGFRCRWASSSCCC